MATFQITGPDGKKYRVSGDNPEGAFQALQQHIGGADVKAQNDQFAAQAAKLDQTDLSIARSKNDAFGAYLRGEAQKPRSGEDQAARDQRLYGSPMAGPSKLQSGLVGWADTASAGFADEMGAGLDAALTSRTYDQSLRNMREMQRQSETENPNSYLAGQIGGGLTQAAVLGGGGLSAGANAMSAGQSLGRVALGSAIDAGAQMGAYGVGSGETASERAWGGLTGAGSGAIMGAATPYLMAGVSKVASPIISPIGAALFPEKYAQKALGTAVRRSGMTVDDIANSLSAAQADGQGMYAVADAMGNSGQRMLSTVARNPSDTRQAITDALMKRQSGQGERLSSFLADGFGATDTATQTASKLTAARSAAADANYAAARNSAGAVDPSAAIAKADEFLTPGVTGMMNPGTNIADDGVESAVRRARSYLTDGKSVVSDFNTALRSKQELDAMIEKATPTVQRQLIPIRNELDNALAKTSKPYAAARDTFRQQSKAIDAIDTGKASTSSRLRAADTIKQFMGFGPEEQAAFRSGYADPLIAKVEAASSSPTTNKARLLMTEKTAQEFPAFAEPGKANQLGSRLAREQRMFETANTALGGSKTADNLADAADLGQYDPGMLATLATDGIKGVLVKSIQGVADRARGMSPRVIDHVGKSLMETNPQAAKDILNGGLARLSKADKTRAVLLNALIGGNVTTPSRITNPR